ncbi:MAG TPA: methionine--tRNA ligase [Bryobacteraceae bacterium]|nr:methionine--tRNA ligase [Bryobacteraceae bacterium]
MKYYLTTPIYYVNAAPHIGHAYTTIAADTIRRFKTMQGFDVVLATGTDEHGQKIERAAKAAGQTPQEFTTVIAEEFRAQWQALHLAIDRFQRTTSPQHQEVVQDLFTRCLNNGYVYKGSYTGQYCVSCELYVNEAQPGDPCPDCGRPTETVTEENYFFKLSAFQDKLVELNSNPEFLQPETRRNEVLAFLKQGLNDLSISRTTIKWGIPLPVEGNHVFYVWFDALATYMSAVEGQGLWPADLHLIGKEIVRFHAVYWPAFLIAAGLEIPKKIFAHGWLLFENDKMSKSRGNIVRATPIQQVMGADALRYFLLREVVFGTDGTFSYDALVGRYNSDLANGLGNLVSRTLSMIGQYRGGVVPANCPHESIATQTNEAVAETIQAFDRFEFSRGLEILWSLVRLMDRTIVEYAPWKLAKDDSPEAQAKLNEILYSAAEVLRIVTVLLYPVMPQSAEKIWKQLGMEAPLASYKIDQLRWGQFAGSQKIGEISPLFMRLDTKATIEAMQDLELKETTRQAALFGKTAAVEPDIPIAPIADPITIDDFGKVDLRVGEVLSAEPVKGADKLLQLKVNIGEAEPRTIVAGIAKAYAPEQLIGRKVVIVANLAPRKLRGIESKGMIVAASLEGQSPVLASFLEDIQPGARLK